jgi:hypothetical protein
MNERLLTGKQWSEILQVEILDPKGWTPKDTFNSLFITRAEFCNRAALSELKTKIAGTRREASKLRGEYKNKQI